MIEALQQHSWQLVEIGIDSTLQPVPAEASITLQFEGEARVHGKSACNRYFASYSLDGPRLRIGAVGATRMMCPEPLMSLESDYFAALEHVESYQ
jgi:heat shock protein HslJ